MQERVRRFFHSAVEQDLTEPVRSISQENMLCLVGWKSYWQSVLHKLTPHGCGTDTPAHTYPIYPAAVRDYQMCVNICMWRKLLFSLRNTHQMHPCQQSWN